MGVSSECILGATTDDASPNEQETAKVISRHKLVGQPENK